MHLQLLRFAFLSPLQIMAEPPRAKKAKRMTRSEYKNFQELDTAPKVFQLDLAPSTALTI